MFIRITILLISLTLSACAQIKIDDAKVDNPQPGALKKLQLKTLNKEARQAINAMNPDDLVAVFTKNGIILYGIPGKGFKFVIDAPKIKKEPVNDVNIKTFVYSPQCQLISDGAGGGIWYPSDCPR